MAQLLTRKKSRVKNKRLCRMPPFSEPVWFPGLFQGEDASE